MTVNAWHHASNHSLRDHDVGEELLSDLDTEDVGETGADTHRRRLHTVRTGWVSHVGVEWQRIVLISPDAQVVVALLGCLVESVWLVVILLEVTVSEGVLTLEDFVVEVCILWVHANTRASCGEEGLEFDAWVQLDRF